MIDKMGRPFFRALVTVTVLAGVAAGALAAFAWQPEIAPIVPPARTAFDAGQIERGAGLADAGNCIACHTVPGRQAFAGGLPLSTPFGTIYSTNITPDPATGIGRWSQEAFDRSMRSGLDRSGSHLYPAFPYTHFASVVDADLRALYAYLMTRTPVHARAPENELMFPLGFRPLLAGWKLLFFDSRPFRPNAAQSVEWNRGAYLSEGLAHCSACHSPLNAFGAERKGEHLSGGFAEGWYAPALNAASPTPVPWSVKELMAYLRTGLVDNHAIAGGPMQDVVRSLGRLSEEDVHAIAVYIHSLMGSSTPELLAAKAQALKQRAGQGSLELASTARSAAESAESPELRLGATIYAGACASCHDLGRGPSSGRALQLPLAVALYEPNPASFIRIVKEGIAPGEGERGRLMPSFGGALTDEQMTALAIFLRRVAADAPPWPDVAGEVGKAYRERKQR